MNELTHVMLWPFLACLAMTGIHAYLGMHVIERQVIFVDLALAQIAVLGSAFALLAGWSHDGKEAYLLSLVCTLAGAAVFALTRFKEQKIPHEAIIGIVYAVAASLLVILLSRSGEGDEHIREALVGNILLVDKKEVLKISGIYAAVGIFHFIFRQKFLMISRNPVEAYRQRIKVRLWDFLFYVSFGLVVTSSVKIAGVLLVFSLLIIPASAAVLLAEVVQARLIWGWIIGAIGCVLGIIFSYYGDFPTAASVVCALALILFLVGFFKRFVGAR